MVPLLISCVSVGCRLTVLVSTLFTMTNSYPTVPGMADGAHPFVNDDCCMTNDHYQLPTNGFCLPNALTSWPQIRERLDKKRLAIFLDYDGTLSPHVPDPEKAIISDEMRAVLKKLSELYTVSIITGRPMKTIRRFLDGMDNMFYAASHGLDITFDSEDSERHIVADDHIPYLEAAYDELRAVIGRIPGCILENNDLSVSVHYRNVESEADKEKMHEAVTKVLAEYRSHINIIYGEKVWELRPNKDWDKGKAVEYILSLKFQDTPTIAVYLGDDTTDEDAFKVVRQLEGISVLVNKQKKATAAEFVVADPTDVQKFLNLLTETASSLQY